MSREQFANNAQTTTTGVVNNSSDPVTVAVTSATGFPTAGNFRIKIDSEILLVTAVSGLNFTATRAQESTTIATHASGATVTHILTAASLKAAINERVVTAEMVPPVESGFSWVNQGTATVSETQGWSYLSDEMAALDEWRLRVKSTPATPYTKTICFRPNNNLNGLAQEGFILRESGTGEFIAFALVPGSGATAPAISITKWDDVNTFNTSVYNVEINELHFAGYVWLRVENDGTDLFYYTSSDGSNFNLIFTAANGSLITIDQYGYALNTVGTPATDQLTGVNILSLD